MLKVVNFILPIICILGDGKSSDNICRRYSHNSVLAKRLIWSCNVVTEHCDDPNAACKLLEECDMRPVIHEALGMHDIGEYPEDKEAELGIDRIKHAQEELGNYST